MNKFKVGDFVVFNSESLTIYGIIEHINEEHGYGRGYKFYIDVLASSNSKAWDLNDGIPFPADEEELELITEEELLAARVMYG